MAISIHVPSWGTTVIPTGHRSAISYFNPRSLVGNDDNGRILSADYIDFNPRSLVGNDLESAQEQDERMDFNPRSLVGNDELLRLRRLEPL